MINSVRSYGIERMQEKCVCMIQKILNSLLGSLRGGEGDTVQEVIPERVEPKLLFGIFDWEVQ